MAETYLEITQQIEALKQKAETIRESEIAGVIERIRTAIQAYGLTPEQLFDARPAQARTPGVQRRARPAAKRSAGAKFRDDAGNSWSGRGPRPRWIKAALAAGKKIEDFMLDDKASSGAAPKSAPLTAKYRDGDGHSWSGRGPRPGWVKAALEAGKTLDDLRG